jgi:hypothetical protein
MFGECCHFFSSLQKKKGIFVKSIVTDNTTWMHHFMHIKRTAMQQKHPVSSQESKIQSVSVCWEIYDNCILGCRSCSCWICGLGHELVWTPTVTWCDSCMRIFAGRDVDICCCVWFCSMTVHLHRGHTGPKSCSLFSVAPSRPSTLKTWPWATEATLGNSRTIQ